MGDAKKDKKEKKEKKDKKDKKDKKEKKEKKEKKAEGEDDDNDEAGTKEVKEPKEKKEKKSKKEGKEKKEKKEKKAKKTKKEASDDDEDSDDGKAKGKADDLEWDSEEVNGVIETMTQFVESKNGKVKAADFFEELRQHQLAKDFDHKVRLYVALAGLMPNGSMDAKAITDHSKAIEKPIKSVSMPGSDVLFAFGAYLAANSKSSRTFPMVLKAVYDEEWATDADILKYYDEEEGSGDPGFDEAKKVAAPFIKWLQTTEESDDDDEDDDDSDDD